MTRRERHLRIIESFDDRSQRFERELVIGMLGPDALSDAAVERIASRLVGSHKIRKQERARVDRFFAAQRTA